MKFLSGTGFYLRILLVSLAVSLLGIAPQPYSVVELLDEADQATSSSDWLTASQDLASAAEYFPWWYELDLQAGRLAFKGGDPGNAIQYLERPAAVLHLSNDDLILLGDAYLQTDHPYIAESLWKRVIESNNSASARERLVNLYLQRKDYGSAAAHLQSMLTINPSNKSLYYQIGSLYAAIDPLKALPYLIQAVALDPANASQAQALYDVIRTASLFDQPAYTLVMSGRQLASGNQWELAVGAFRQATVLEPVYTEAWAFLGEALQQQAVLGTVRDPGAGHAELEHAIQLDASSTIANTFMALYWERKDEFSKAQAYIQRAIDSNPTDPYLYTELASILAKSGDLPASQSAYNSAIQLAPQDPVFYRLLAEFALEYQIQIRELALPAARQAISLDPNGAISLDVMAQVMLMLKDYHSAERFAQLAIHSDASYAPAYLHLGITYLYLGEPELAQQWLVLAETVNPGSLTASQAERMTEYYFPGQ